jgi:hypothetical protein
MAEALASLSVSGAAVAVGVSVGMAEPPIHCGLSQGQ